jgi:sugar porter (SP) family MFS transporter
MKSHSPLLRITLIAALGGFLFGFDTAVISGTTSALEQVFELSKWRLGFTVATALIGTILGSLLVGYPGDRFGRKRVLIVMAVFYTVSALGSALAQQWYFFIFFRFLGGLAVGGASVMSPMYIAEIAPAKIRGRLVALQQFNVVTGILIAFLSNYLIAGTGLESPWRWMLGVETLPAALFFFLLFTIPQSPRWLVMHGRNEEAEKVLFRIGNPRHREVVKEIEESIKGEVEAEKETLFQRKYSLPILTTVLIAMFNQLSGINAIMYYAPRIFEMTGLGNDAALLQSVAIGVTNMLFTILALFTIDRFGRRRLLIIGSFGMIFFLGMIARAFYLESFGGYSVMFYLIGFIAFFAYSQGAVIWVFISEIFPNKVRAKGQALGSFTHWFMAAAISWIFPVAANSEVIGGGHSFAFFSVMMVLHLLFAWKIIPETKGKSLEQIQSEISNRKKQDN